MGAANCARCGRMFVRMNKNICPDCVKIEESKFESVREYVKENPNCTLQEVSSVCDVSSKRILQYVKDGRLELSTGMQGDLTCSKCGKPIRIGRLCEKCIVDVSQKITGMREQRDIKNKGRVFMKGD